MKQTLYHVGKISKTHGYSGTVVVVSDNQFGTNIENIKEVFLLIEGILTPFFVEEFRLLTNTSAHMRLEFVDSEQNASELVGRDVHATIASQKPKVEAERMQYIGYAVHDAKHGKVGDIVDVKDYNGNVVMQIMDGKKETLISQYAGLITKICDNSKTMYIDAPDGYF